MPYIEQNERGRLDPVVDLMDKTISFPKDLSYILFKFFMQCITPGYQNYCEWIGTINLTVMEINRRMIAPYENRKIRENGDVTVTPQEPE